MTVVLPKNYTTKSQLEEKRIQCKNYQEALEEDIRALRIGILNIMPRAETYEFRLLYPLGRSILQIEPVWIRLKTHNYKSSEKKHLEDFYISFEQSIENTKLDGLIITGAPVEEIPFEDVVYWDEITGILDYAKNNIPSTLGICWGGLALAKYIGIEKEMFDKKLFGVFETRTLHRDHHITSEMDDIFWCPQSRHSGISDRVLEDAENEGRVNLLAHSERGGYVIFETPDTKFLMHLGHPEYHSRRLIEEYERDLKEGRSDVLPPENIDTARPVNRWRAHRFEFFSQWIKFIHERKTW